MPDDVPGDRPAPREPGGDRGRRTSGPGTDPVEAVAEAADLPVPHVRAGARLGVALAALVPLVVVLGPVALLVHDRWGPLLRLDTATSAAADRLSVSAPVVARVARVLTHLGDPLVVTVGSLVAAAVLWATGRGRPAAFVLLSRAGSQLLSTGLKGAVGRARPHFADPVATAFGASFPSGHALGSAAFYTALAVVLLPLAGRRRPLVLGAAVVVPLVVAATRVLIGVHYLSDVLAGLVLGASWTLVCTAVFVQWRREEGRPADVATAGVEAR